MKIDRDRLMKAIMEKASSRIESRREAIVKAQYCPEHDQYASVEEYNVAQQPNGNSTHELKYRCCCDDLREKVKAALRADGTGAHSTGTAS